MGWLWTSPTTQPTPEQEDPPSESSTTLPPQEPPPSPTSPPPAPLLRPEHIYPTTASCRQLFDLAFACQSPQGQFRNGYRYGTMRDCQQTWDDVWWCLRTQKGWNGEEERRELCMKRAWEREGRVRREGSSEDVWRQRKRLLRGGWGGEGQPGGPRKGVGPWEGGEEGRVRIRGREGEGEGFIAWVERERGGREGGVKDEGV